MSSFVSARFISIETVSTMIARQSRAISCAFTSSPAAFPALSHGKAGLCATLVITS